MYIFFKYEDKFGHIYRNICIYSKTIYCRMLDKRAPINHYKVTVPFRSINFIPGNVMHAMILFREPIFDIPKCRYIIRALNSHACIVLKNLSLEPLSL